MTSRSDSTPRLAAQASAYWAMKAARPRSRNMPMMATGTIHSAKPRGLPKPLSSRIFSSAGSIGSVVAATAAAAMATPKPRRLVRK